MRLIYASTSLLIAADRVVTGEGVEVALNSGLFSLLRRRLLLMLGHVRPCGWVCLIEAGLGVHACCMQLGQPQQRRITIANLYYAHGLKCATYPAAVIAIAVVVVFVCR